MAVPTVQHQPQTPEHAPPTGQPVAAPPAPGLEAVKAIKGDGEPAAANIVQVLRAHPDERDAIMAWLHQHRGNTFVQQVVQQLGQVERALPAGVDVKSVRASVMIPGRRKLEGTWTHTVATREPSVLEVEVTHTGVSLSMSPALHVDATWPLQNCDIYTAGVHFADGQPYADVQDGHGLGSGMISIKDRVHTMITDKLRGGLRKSPLSRPGYDLAFDPDLGATLHAVTEGCQKMFAEPSDHSAFKAPVTPGEMSNVSAGATVSSKAGAQFVKDGSGLILAPGSELTISVDGTGNLADVAGAPTAQAGVEAAHVRAVSLSTAGLQVVSKGKPLVQISGLTLRPGGAITVDHMQLLGKAADAQAVESGLSLIAALIAYAGHDSSAGDLMRNAEDPKVVDGVTRSMIEKEFTETVHRLLMQYRAAVPGLDLAKALGIG